MSLQQVKGQSGYYVQSVASGLLSKSEIGKFTDSNHLDRILEQDDAQKYDRNISTLFSQGYNDKSTFFDNLVENASTFYVNNPNIPFYWEVDLPTELPKIVDIPSTTTGLAKIGYDEQTFQFICNRKVFVLNDVVALGSYEHGPQIEIVADPLPYNGHYLYTAILSNTDKTEYLTSKWFHIGVPLLKVDNSIGEFDQNLSSIALGGGKIKLYDRLGAGFGVEHTTTSWADQVVPVGKDGHKLDLEIITKYEKNQKGEIIDVQSYWSRTIETALKKEMRNMKIRRFLHGAAATTRTSAQQQEIKYKSDGIMRKVRKAGNHLTLPKGSFSINILRNLYDVFYDNRVDIKDRAETVLYTNKAGMKAFKEASKADLMNAGFQINIGEGNRFVQGNGQDIVLNWGVNGVVTEETGRIRMVLLPELDYRSTDKEYGKTRQRPPVFLSLDVLNNSEQSIKNNIRIVRPKGQPGPTWGYIDGRRSHNGFAASQGMQSASKYPGSTIWMEDRCDLRIDDLSRTLLIEEESSFLY